MFYKHFIQKERFLNNISNETWNIFIFIYFFFFFVNTGSIVRINIFDDKHNITYTYRV